MTIEQFIEALRQYPQNAQIKCGLSVPALYINTIANLSISGDNPEASQCTVVRLVTTAPDLVAAQVGPVAVAPPDPTE